MVLAVVHDLEIAVARLVQLEQEGEVVWVDGDQRPASPHRHTFLSRNRVGRSEIDDGKCSDFGGEMGRGGQGAEEEREK